MSDSLRPCWKCDYLLAADAGQSRCPECGVENNFAEMDGDAQSALDAPLRTLVRGRVFSSDPIRKLWRARHCQPSNSARWRALALLAGFLLPVIVVVASAAVGLETRVQCIPHPVTHAPTSNGMVAICSPYHRPPFIEMNRYSWSGWNCSGIQSDYWGHRAILNWEQIDRTLVGRSICMSPAWSYWPHSIWNLISIVVTIGSWWLLAALWSALIVRKLRRIEANIGSQSVTYSDLMCFRSLILAASGMIFVTVLFVDLFVRLTVPDFGIVGRGTGWYSMYHFLPFSICIPAILFWWVSIKGPPGVARTAQWFFLAIGTGGAIVRLLIARLGLPKSRSASIGRCISASR